MPHLPTAQTVVDRLRDDEGAATAEYAIATMATVVGLGHTLSSKGNYLMNAENESNNQHRFLRWEPRVPLSDEDQKSLNALEFSRSSKNPRIIARIQELEGDLVPVCGCGWRGLGEDWVPLRQRTRTGGEQFLRHQRDRELKVLTQGFAANVSARTLRLAAEAWEGETTVKEFLEDRARYIEEIGHWDGRYWP